MTRPKILLSLALLGGALALPAAAAPIIITQSSIAAGNITPGDAPGFPATISVPGSYRLGGNLSVPADKTGIDVTTADVAIDLDGFRIAGGPAGGSSNGIVGISTAGDRLTVRNGTITGFEGAAIQAVSRLLLVVEDMRLVNSRFGVDAASSKFTRILNSALTLNLVNGVRCATSCHVEGSIVASNGGSGIVMYTGTVLGNTLTDNGGYAVGGSTADEFAVGFGNNTVIGNNKAGAGTGRQTIGHIIPLQPNVCAPRAC